MKSIKKIDNRIATRDIRSIKKIRKQNMDEFYTKKELKKVHGFTDDDIKKIKPTDHFGHECFKEEDIIYSLKYGKSKETINNIKIVFEQCDDSPEVTKQRLFKALDMLVSEKDILDYLKRRKTKK